MQFSRVGTVCISSLTKKRWLGLSSDRASIILTTIFYLRSGCTRCVLRGVSEGYSVVFQAAIKAQWSNRCLVVLLKQTKLYFLFCPSADCTVLFGAINWPEKSLSDALDQTDDGCYNETEDEELHWCTSLIARKVLYFPTVLFFFLSSNPVIFCPLVERLTSHHKEQSSLLFDGEQAQKKNNIVTSYFIGL